MDDHDLQRQTVRYKWMIMICRGRLSGTNELSLSAQTDPQLQMDYYDLHTDTQLQMDDHDLQRQTLRYKWMIMICKDRLSGTNG